jgi:Flp pilus assembly secretin CpaC
MRSIVRFVLLLSLSLFLALRWTPASAAGVQVEVGRTVKIKLPRQPRIIGVEDPTIATLRLLPDGHALVTGRRIGRTRIIGRDFAEVPIIIKVAVVPPKGSSSRLGRQPHQER